MTCACFFNCAGFFNPKSKPLALLVPILFHFVQMLCIFILAQLLSFPANPSSVDQLAWGAFLRIIEAMARRSPLSLILALALAAVAVRFVAPAFAPGLQRRDVLAGLSAATVATVGAQSAWADAQGEPVTCLARYGPQVLKLQEAVDKGDMEMVLKKEPKFKALNSYWRNQPGYFEQKVGLSEKIMEAADAGKKDEVKKLYTEYVSDPVFEAFKVPVKRSKDTVTIYAYGAGKSVYDK